MIDKTPRVFDPMTGIEVGSAVTVGVSCFALRMTAFGLNKMNLLFLEAPVNANGTNSGGQLELAAVWNRTLSSSEVARLSAVPDGLIPEPGRLSLLDLALVGLRFRRSA